MPIWHFTDRAFHYPFMYLFFQTFPFFGVVPLVLNEEGKEVEGETEGYIVRNFYLKIFFIKYLPLSFRYINIYV